MTAPDLATLDDPALEDLQNRVESERLRRAVRQAVAEHDAKAREIPQHLSVRETAQMLNRSVSWVFHNWQTALPFGFHDGGRLLFPAEKVREYLRRLPRGGRARTRVAS